MTEQFLYYIWQNRLFMAFPQCTTDGRTVEVIDVGRHNTDAGPDFFNAKIKIDGVMWAGNVEMHLRSSDWGAHGHAGNKAYDNVILHVVAMADSVAPCRSEGSEIPQCVLVYPPVVVKRYETLLYGSQTVACEKQLKNIPELTLVAWKDRLLTERLEHKTNAITSLLAHSANNWEDAFYVTLARNFGFHTNGLAFELLAKSLPLACLAKHKNDIKQIEALLFGQAGLLDEGADEYARELQREYRFLASKFSLTPIKADIWKMARMRPVNSPYVRIAQFAALVHGSSKLFSQIIDCTDIAALRGLFDVAPSLYWSAHYRFGKPSVFSVKSLGVASIDVVIINTVVPFVFAYGRYRDCEELCARAIDWLQRLPAENNAVVKTWKGIGVSIENAYDSQAFLQLNEAYCEPRHCLQCRIAHNILTAPYL